MESTALHTGFVSSAAYATETAMNFIPDWMERINQADSIDNEPIDEYNFQVIIKPLTDPLPKRSGIRNYAGKSNCTKCGLCGLHRKF